MLRLILLWGVIGQRATLVPTDFDCAWRNFALDQGRLLLPRLGDFNELKHALELNKCLLVFCGVSELANGSQHPLKSLWCGDTPG